MGAGCWPAQATISADAPSIRAVTSKKWATRLRKGLPPRILRWTTATDPFACRGIEPIQLIDTSSIAAARTTRKLISVWCSLIYPTVTYYNASER